MLTFFPPPEDDGENSERAQEDCGFAKFGSNLRFASLPSAGIRDESAGVIVQPGFEKSTNRMPEAGEDAY